MRAAWNADRPNDRGSRRDVSVVVVPARTLVYPAGQARQVMARWRGWTRGLTERVSTSVVLVDVARTRVPPSGGSVDGPDPVLPDGAYVIVRIRWNGDGGPSRLVGLAGVRGWRRWSRPVLELPGDGGGPGDEFALATVDALVMATFPTAGDPAAVLAGLPPYRSARYSPDQLAG